MIQSSTHTHLSTLLDSTRRRAALGVGIALLSCLSIGCGAEDDDTPPTMQEPEPFPLVGQWASPFGEETLTEDNWAFMTLVEHDSTLRVALTQNPADDAFNPSKYNKLVWTPPDATGSFYYCTVAFGLDTLGDARDAQDTSEATDPATGGCGGFPWTPLTVKP